MQKKIIALAIAGLASTAAFAQTNVTVYGVVDVGVAHMSATGLKSQNAVESGMLAGSRLGFKGVEDLGNGLKAIFTLEYSLAADDNTGVGALDQAGTFTGAAAANNNNTNWSSSQARQQFVGLTGGFGTAVMGRLQTAGYDWSCAYNPIAGTDLDTIGKLGAATVLSCGSGGRANNALAYISPSFGGVTVALNHARLTEAAELKGNTTPAGDTKADNSATLLGVSYAGGPVAAGLVYSRVNVANTAAADNIKEFGLGGSYDFGVVKLFANYQQQKQDKLTLGSDRKYSLGVVAPVSAAGAVVASFAKNKINSTTAADNSKSYTLAYLHNLSKRTTVYAGYNHVSNDAGAGIGIVGTTNAALTNVGYQPNLGAGGGSASVIGAGIKHSF